jgi:hypothetical protein
MNTIQLTINLNVEEETLAKLLAMAGSEEQMGAYVSQLMQEANHGVTPESTGTAGSFDEELEAKLATMG